MRLFQFFVIIILANQIVSDINFSNNKKLWDISQHISLIIEQAKQTSIRANQNMLLLRLEHGNNFSFFNDIASEVLPRCRFCPVVVHTYEYENYKNQKKIAKDLVNQLAFVVIVLDSFDFVSIRINEIAIKCFKSFLTGKFFECDV